MRTRARNATSTGGWSSAGSVKVSHTTQLLQLAWADGGEPPAGRREPPLTAPWVSRSRSLANVRFGPLSGHGPQGTIEHMFDRRNDAGGDERRVRLHRALDVVLDAEP